MKTTLFFAITMFALSSCEFIGACTDSYDPGIEVTFKNEAGEYVASEVTAVVFDGNYRDTLREHSSDQMHLISLAGAYERPGVYSLVVESDKYKTYTTSGILVKNGQCHVIAAKLEVTLKNK